MHVSCSGGFTVYSAAMCRIICLGRLYHPALFSAALSKKMIIIVNPATLTL